MENYIDIIYNEPVVLTATNVIQYTDLIGVIIDNIPCQLAYCIGKGHWWFHIQDNCIHEDDNFQSNYIFLGKCRLGDKNIFKDFDEGMDITPEIIEKFIKIILEFMGTLKFSKFEGRFISKKSIQKEALQKIVFSDFMEKETSQEVCSVCLEPTKTRTACNHTLCIPCWQQVKEENKVCPLCRESISFFRNSYEG